MGPLYRWNDKIEWNTPQKIRNRGGKKWKREKNKEEKFSREIRSHRLYVLVRFLAGQPKRKETTP